MADRVVPVDVRAMVVAWPGDAPRGAVSRFCREHAVSRSWFYEVRARVGETDALTAMRPRSRSLAGRSRQAIPIEVEELAVRIRKELADAGWDHGPVTVAYRLGELGVHVPAASTLARVFRRRGMVVAQPRKRPRSSYRRFEFAMVHQCWQLDAFQWPLANGAICVVYQVLDDRSRALLASHVTTTETAEGAIAVIDKAIHDHQVPVLLLTDNGAAFNQTRLGRSSRLVTHLEARGARAITGRPGHPQTQGKDERVHQTTQRWLRAHPRAGDQAELTAQLEEFDEHYNNHRPHQSLAMRTPAQALAHGPRALPPPPPPEGSRQDTAAPMRALRRRVDAHGKTSIKRASVQLGYEHRNSTVTVVLHGENATIFDQRGTHIRSLSLQPGRTYYGNGRPRGWNKTRTVQTDPRHQQCPDQPET
jgi:putative transposase